MMILLRVLALMSLMVLSSDVQTTFAQESRRLSPESEQDGASVQIQTADQRDEEEAPESSPNAQDLDVQPMDESIVPKAIQLQSPRRNLDDSNPSADTPYPGSSESPTAEEAETAAAPPSDQVGLVRPICAVCLGVFVVLALMIKLKTHAFIALILGALTISCFVPLDVTGFKKNPPTVVRAETGQPVNVVNRVTSSLGNSVVGIGVLIAMAAIIGKCMLVSGAADQIVQSSLRLLGEKRAALALMVSGFILSIPVFFDTVFYLLVPLARSLYRNTKKNYLLYLAAIAAGGAITHTLVPPTPGPLLVADALSANIGTVMLIGLVVGFPTALVGLIAASWLNKKMPIEMRPMSGNQSEETELTELPSLWMSLLPVILPVILITITTILKLIANANPEQTAMDSIYAWMNLLGSPNMAMIYAALFSMYLCIKIQGHTLKELAEHVEDALLSGGVIILITAAGGAFGALLAMTQIQNVVQSLFTGSDSGGIVVLIVAFVLASLIKIAQGSSTVAMIITSSLIASIAMPLIKTNSLGFHEAYLVPVIGAGSLMGSWMNDSGFWVFAKMGVLTEGETLKSWTVLLSILSITAFVLTLIMAMIFPMVSASA